jgi:SAM-dependent methyltransferase
METDDDLRSFYEAEAKLGTRGTPTGRRVDLRARYIELLASEGRRSVVDFGAGPGTDGPAFVEAGLDYVGVDLAHGNGVLARDRGLTVLQGSVITPPLRPRSFEAGWSMSTLMHLKATEFQPALTAMVALLTPGSPFLIGTWGGRDEDLVVVDESKIDGQRRDFHLRTYDENRHLFASVCPIEHEDRWDSDSGGTWEDYQIFQLRVPL